MGFLRVAQNTVFRGISNYSGLQFFTTNYDNLHFFTTNHVIFMTFNNNYRLSPDNCIFLQKMAMSNYAFVNFFMRFF